MTASDTDSTRLKGRRRKEVGSMCSWKGEVESWANAEGYEKVKGTQLGRRRSKTLAVKRTVTRENVRRR